MLTIHLYPIHPCTVKRVSHLIRQACILSFPVLCRQTPEVQNPWKLSAGFNASPYAVLVCRKRCGIAWASWYMLKYVVNECKWSKYNQYTGLILMILTSKLEPPNKNLKQCYKLLARAPLEVRRKLHPSVVCPNDAASAFLGEAARQPFEVVYPILAVTLQNWANVPAVMNHSSHKGIYEVDSDWVHHWDLMIQLW